MTTDIFKQVSAALRAARGVVVLTGAGISAESGLRTFRGSEQDMTSLWKEFDPQTLATPEAFNADPEMVRIISKYNDEQLLAISAYQSSLVMPGKTCKAKTPAMQQ